MSGHYYTPDDLDGFDKDKLEIIAEARGLTVEGTGTDGNILKDDLAAAITADQDASGLNPALEPAPMEAAKPKRYRVGASSFEGHVPGSEFDAVLPADREQMLLEGGALQIVQPVKAAAKTTTTSPTASASAPKTKE